MRFWAQKLYSRTMTVYIDINKRRVFLKSTEDQLYITESRHMLSDYGWGWVCARGGWGWVCAREEQRATFSSFVGDSFLL